MISKRLAWLMTLGYGLTILAVSSIPARVMPAGEIWRWDKVIHAFEYGLGAAILFFALRLGQNRSLLRSALLTLVVCSLFGVIDELYQSTVPGRDSSPFDMLADFVGASFGSAASLVFYSRKEIPDVDHSQL